MQERRRSSICQTRFFRRSSSAWACGARPSRAPSAAAGARGAADAVSWARLEVTARSGRDLLPGLQLFDAQDAQSKGWIRVARGASLRLLDFPCSVAVSFVGACVASCGGLGEVHLHCDPSAHACLYELLGALVPPGGVACPSLRSIHLSSSGHHSCDLDFEGSPGGLDALLRPYPNLENFSLGETCLPDADALGRCLPRLKRVTTCLESFGDAAGLAVLPALELLDITDYACFEGNVDSFGLLLDALASGPAARSLKELLCSPTLSGAALRTLPRLDALQRLRSDNVQLGLKKGDVEKGDLEALGSCPALRSLGPLCLPDFDNDEDGEEAIIGCLSGLTAAFARSPTLTDLDLRIGSPLPPPALEALAALADAARGRLSLEMEVDLAPGRPAEAAAALAAAPPRRLALAVAVGAEALRGGWLDGLAAFAACSAGDTEVRLRTKTLKTSAERAQARDAARAAVARALPSAGIVDIGADI
eukprot:tig00000147_g9504.t1